MVAGSDSQLWPHEHAAAAVQDLPHGRSVVIADAGHAVTFDQPDAFNDALLEFLGELEPTDSLSASATPIST